ncbi:MAG: outer membrane lipoprotein carrier protein LolA [Polyangiaceae bacterium]
MPYTLRRRTLLAFAATAPLATLVRPAFADSTSDALDKVAKARSSLKTLSAKFEQTRLVGLLAEPVKSTGELILVRPDQLRWELYPPDAATYWVSSKGIFYRNGSSGKAVQAGGGARDFTAVLNDLIAFVGGDMNALKSRYSFSASNESDGSVSVTADPTDDKLKKVIKRIGLRTSADLWGVSKIVLEEANGDSSTIVFSKNEKDGKVDPDKMKPPV